jgi:hypothetical protein
VTTQVPQEVWAALLGLPAPLRPTLLEVRALILDTAAAEGAGPLTETLKWGEPAYLTEVSRSGTTIRLGATRAAAPRCAVYFNCKTSLVDGFRARFSEAFSYEGKRALVLPEGANWSREALAICLAEALTYHRRKSGRDKGARSARVLASQVQGPRVMPGVTILAG